MGWFGNLFKGPTPHPVEVEAPKPKDTTPNMDDESLLAVGQILGLTKDDLTNPNVRDELKKLAANPGAMGVTNDGNFVDFWDKAGFIECGDVKRGQKDSANKRNRRYADYQFMTRNSSDIRMALRTYVDEIISTMRDEDDFFIISVKGKDGKDIPADAEFLNQMLKEHGVLGNPRQRQGELCQYGDSYYLIESIRQADPEKDKGIPTVEGWIFEGRKIDHPSKVERINIPNKDVPFKFKLQKSDQAKGTMDIPPWDMIHYRISSFDSDLMPYGEPLIEPARSIYKRTLISEALLSLTRASRVERLIVKVPTMTNNPDIAITKMMRMRTLMKSVLLGSGKNPVTEKKIPAFTDILFVPKGTDDQSSFDIDQMRSSIDLGNIDDVEYFRKQMLNGLAMPQGWLDSSERYQGYRKLALQDLKLSRAINQPMRAEAEGVTLLCKIILFRTGKWSNDKTVLVSYNPPAPIANEQLEGLSRAIDTILKMVESTAPKDDEGNTKFNSEVVRNLLISLARIPRRIVDMILPKKSGKKKTLTSEEIKGVISAAFLTDMKVESVSSKDFPFLDWEKARVAGGPQRVTEEMIV